MTDNEIKKAFKICNNLEDGYCSDCPYEYCDRCIREVARNTLDLINRLQAENERLQKDSKRLKKVQMQLDDAMKMYFEIKSEAIKEFAERLKGTFPKDDFLRSTKQISKDIDNLLKEMVGEDNAL